MTSRKEVLIDWQPDKGSALPVYKQITQYMIQKISQGHWVIGSHLPSQRKLSQQFGVNRSTVITALEELTSYGILKSDDRSGTYVASNTWSLLMSTAPPDWGTYLKAGTFRANVPTIQAINKLEFEEGYIRLGTGELAPELFPTKMMAQIFSQMANRIPSLNYLGTLGLPELREALAERLNRQGIPATPAGILITSGSLQALHLISVCMLKPGSWVYTEAPSYVKSLELFQSAGMKLKGIPLDEEGLIPWQLSSNGAALTDSLLYTIPSFHNPTGTVMSEKRRQELFRFCQNHRLPIIEDNAYGELWLDEPPARPLKTLDDSGMILYLGTVSKTLAPGLRIGWLVGPESVTERLGDVKMQMDYGASSLSQWALTELFSSGAYDEHLDIVRQQLKHRRDLCLALLQKHFGDLAEWNIPTGSFYIWLKLKGSVSTDVLFHKALAAGLLINPGSVYDYQKNSHLRLSYAYASIPELEEGLIRLAQTIRAL